MFSEVIFLYCVVNDWLFCVLYKKNNLMKIYFVSIFPHIFNSFVETSLISKWVEKKILEFEIVNPRDFTEDKHKQVDDEIYWWWVWMLMKAKVVIDSVESILYKEKLLEKKSKKWKIIFLTPSKNIFNQKKAYSLSEYDILILVCWRYEWIDFRFEQYIQKKYPNNFEKISIWRFIVMWWEIPAMLLTEAVVRLVPGVIKEQQSFLDESYNPKLEMKNIEYKQYTRPNDVYWMKVPEVLLNWNHKKIEERKKNNIKNIE